MEYCGAGKFPIGRRKNSDFVRRGAGQDRTGKHDVSKPWRLIELMEGKNGKKNIEKPLPWYSLQD